MSRFYFKIALRHLFGKKGYSAIQIFALTIGMTSFILIALYVLDEKSYDRQNVNARDIYRVVSVYDFQGVGERSSSCPFPLGPALQREYPALIRDQVRFFNNWSTPFFVEYGDKGFNERNLFFVDSTVFNIFTIPFVEGDPSTALNGTGTAVITETTAKRYFGDEDPLGKILRVQGLYNLMVTGVIKDPLPESHFAYNILASFSTVRQIYRREPVTWVWNPCWTYILLRKGASPEALQGMLPAFVSKYFYDAEKEHVSLYLQPLLDIHLKSDLDYEMGPNGNIVYVRILMVTGILLLIIACINFINLSTAMAGKRIREIGIKKVLGTHRRQLVIQFITESVTLSVLSLLIALALVEIILPYFSEFTGKTITSHYFYDYRKILLLLGLALVTGVLSGLYPAFYLSAFSPVKTLRGDLTTGYEGIVARRILVVTQFVISIALIIGTISIYRQIRYINNTDLGFRKKDILFIPCQFNPIVNRYNDVKARLLKSPDILYVTAADYIVGTEFNLHEFHPEGFPTDQWQYYPALVVRDDFLETFDIPVVAGRGYSKENKTDPMNGIMINEAMVRYMGWKNDSAALGKIFSSYNGKERVIGVFRDFNAGSLHNKVSPLVLNMKETPGEISYYTSYLVVRYVPGQLSEIVPYIRKVWDQYVPERPFEYKILEEELKKTYREEDILFQLSAIFTAIVLLIATLGLYGLASFTVYQRTKEISIRRILGADFIRIAALLSKEFNMLVLFSVAIAWPLTYLAVSYWFSHFAYHVNTGLLVYLLGGMMALLITTLVTVFKTFTATRLKSVDYLKYE